MFVGHYGASFAGKVAEPSVPLWALFVAVQFLDVLWAPFVLLGVEKARIVPGITASNPLDLYFMPYSHSLVAALLWSAGAYVVWRLWRRSSTGRRAALVVAAAVFSHWVFDVVVHRPDLPLYDDTAKIGLGLWNMPAAAFLLEGALLLGGMWLVWRRYRRGGWLLAAFGLGMWALQARIFFGPPPSSSRAAATMALACYVIFAGAIGFWEKRFGKDAGAAPAENRMRGREP
jgi:hypothetical protein